MKDPVEPFVEKTSAIADGLKDIGVLSPDRTPNHLIATVALASITLINATGEYEDRLVRFVFVVGFLTLIALLSLWLIAHTKPLDDARYKRSLRLSRTLGLVSGCFAFVVSWNVLQKEPSHYFYWLLVASLIQCAVFGYYVYSAQKRLEKDEELNVSDIPSRMRMINNQQLCIVTAALMMGMSFNANIAIEGASEELKGQDSTAVYNAIEDMKRLEQAGDSISVLAAQIEGVLGAKYGGHPSAIEVRDSLNRLELRMVVPSAKSTTYTTQTQHLIVTWIFRVLWILVIVLWGYQILPGMRFSFVGPIQQGPSRTPSMAGDE